MKGKKCFGLLLALFIIFGLSLSVSSNVNAETVTYLSSATIDRAYALGTDMYSNSLSCGSFPCQILQPVNSSAGEYQRFFSGLTNTYGTYAYYSYTIAFTIDIGVYSWQLTPANIEIASSDTISSTVSCGLGGQSSSTAWWWKCSGTGQGNIPSFNIRLGTISAFTSILTTTNVSGNGIRIITPLIQYEFTRDESSALLDYQNSLIETQNGLIQDTNNLLQQEIDQDQQDRDNIEQQSSDNEDSAEQASQGISDASSSIIQHATDIVGAFNTSATDCIISIQTGASGALSLNNMNLCQAPNEILTLIRTISGIAITIAVLFITRSCLLVVFDLVSTLTTGVS